MRIRNVDKDWDWRFGKGNSDYITEAYAVAIDIKMRLKEWKKDCFFALQNGIPWQRRLGHHNQKVFLDGEIRTIVTNTNGVLSITDFESSVKDRKYTCKLNVYQQYSTEILPIEFEMEI